MHTPLWPLPFLAKPTDNVPEDELDIVDAADAPTGSKLNTQALPVEVSFGTSNDRRRMFICHLAARGLSNKQIAEEVGINPVSVSQILKKPEAQAFVAEQMATFCYGQLEQRIKEDCLYVRQKLRQLFDDAVAARKYDVAGKLAKYMEDRYLGTPTAKVEHSQVDPDKVSDAELIRIATGGATNPQS